MGISQPSHNIYMYIPILCLVFRIRSDQVAQQDAERQKFIVEKADVQIIWDAQRGDYIG